MDAKILGRVREGAGFGLSEVLIAIWLLTFIGAGLIATFGYMAKVSQVKGDVVAAELLSEQLLSKALEAGPPDWGQSQLTGTERVQTGDADSKTEFSWALSPSLLQSQPLGRFFEVEVEVRWNAGGPEQGRGEIVRTRYVYIENF